MIQKESYVNRICSDSHLTGKRSAEAQLTVMSILLMIAPASSLIVLMSMPAGSWMSLFRSKHSTGFSNIILTQWRSLLVLCPEPAATVDCKVQPSSKKAASCWATRSSDGIELASKKHILQAPHNSRQGGMQEESSFVVFLHQQLQLCQKVSLRAVWEQRLDIVLCE
jgi:hypothetical protein